MTRFAEGSWNPAINVTAWFLMSTTILSVISRLATKWLIFRKLTSDDYLIVISLIFCVANTIAISMATANGYGDHTDAASHSQQEAVMKSQLAASLLFVLSMLFSKLSMTSFIRNLTPKSRDHILARGLQGLLVAIGLTSVFGTAFQCHVPKTWDYLNQDCINELSWNNFIAVSSMATDALIIVQAMLLIVHVQATFKKKAVFASIFLPRIFVMASSLCQLVLATKHIPSADPFLESSSTTICMEITQSLSIITACWGQLKPFLDRLRSDAFKLSGAEWSATSSSKGSKAPHSHSRSRDARKSVLEFMPPSVHSARTMVSAKKPPEWDEGSHTSETHIIRETRTWAITEVDSH